MKLIYLLLLVLNNDIRGEHTILMAKVTGEKAIKEEQLATETHKKVEKIEEKHVHMNFPTSKKYKLFKRKAHDLIKKDVQKDTAIREPTVSIEETNGVSGATSSTPQSKQQVELVRITSSVEPIPYIYKPYIYISALLFACLLFTGFPLITATLYALGVCLSCLTISSIIHSFKSSAYSSGEASLAIDILVLLTIMYCVNRYS